LPCCDPDRNVGTAARVSLLEFRSLVQEPGAAIAAPDDPAGIASVSSSFHRAAFTASMAKHLLAHRVAVKYLFSSSLIFSNQHHRSGY
jgi:hypothetical protein